ncbi:MAG TPA: YceI family protein [Longimicrobiales bacterium]|nr:YceI family protein [Longimicrobiales bacterium]
MTRQEGPRGRRGAGSTALLALALALPGLGAAQEFHVDRRADNLVRFISRASVEEFEGVTERIDGYVRLDATTLTSGSAGGATEIWLEVDLASLDTGIGLRNRHMRDRYLETAKYPYATFRGTVVRSEADPARAYRITARGTLTIHGVAQPRDLTCRVEPRGPGYRAQCAFEVLLSDHQIEIPKVMFLKLANEISLELDFVVTPAGPPNGDAR